MLQAVFARLQTFERRGLGAFRRWLYTVTQSKLVDFFRASKRRTPAVGGTEIRQRLERLAAPESQSSASALDAAAQAKRRLALEACEWVRKQVSEATWEAYLATEIENLPPKDVGEELGISLNAVYIARSRCRKLLQAAKEHLSESPDYS